MRPTAFGWLLLGVWVIALAMVGILIVLVVR